MGEESLDHEGVKMLTPIVHLVGAPLLAACASLVWIARLANVAPSWDAAVFARFSAINQAILFFVFNEMRQSFCKRKSLLNNCGLLFPVKGGRNLGLVMQELANTTSGLLFVPHAGSFLQDVLFFTFCFLKYANWLACSS